jgi:hypothetical protein
VAEARVKVTFTKESRRYSVLVERDTASTLFGHGPGNDDWLPHDLLHFVAEADFGLDNGIFGTLAAGLPSRAFIPVDPEETVKIWRLNRIRRLRMPDGRRSEQLVARLERQWHDRTAEPERLARLDELAEQWHSLRVGESLTLEWPRPEGRRRHPPRDRRRPARR